MASHFEEIAEHERHNRSMGYVWAVLLVLAAIAVVVGIATSLG